MDLLRTVRFSSRRLLRRPGFSLAAAGTLALGIGATTAIFGVVRGVVLEPLAYPEPDTLVHVHHTFKGGTTGVPDGGYFYYSDNAETLSDFAVYIESSSPVTGLGEPLELGIIQATPSLFPVIKVSPALGRAFTEEDAQPGGDPVVIVSHGFWQRWHGGDPDALGKPVLEGERAIIVGVMPEGFEFVRPEASVVFGNPFKGPDIYLPLGLDRSKARFGNFMYQGIARLAPGATALQAKEELFTLMMEAPLAYPNPGGHTVESLREGGHRVEVVPLKDAVVGHIAGVLWILLAAVGFLLLVATANVANLFIARAESRHREIAIQQALGADRGALMGLFLGESAVLAAAGGVLGVGLAAVGTGLLRRLGPAEIPRLEQVGLDGQVLAVAAGASLIAALVFALLPFARHARLNLRTTMGDEGLGATVSRGTQRTRQGLVVIQVAFALVLLVGSGLLVRTFDNLRRVDPGFDGSHVLTVEMTLPGSEFPKDVDRTRFMLDLSEKVAALPGVERATFTADLPLNGNEWRDAVAVEGALPEKGTLGTTALRLFVGPGYLEAIGARLVRGRELERHDFADQPRAVVVNESFARQRWPDGESPLGKRIAQWWDGIDPAADIWYTVVGVVEDIREKSLMEEPEPTIYLPTVFLPEAEFAMFVRNMILVVETSVEPAALIPDVRRQVQEFHAEVPINAVRTLAAVQAGSFQQVSFAMLLLLIASGVTVALGFVGVYGVVSYVVGQRTREFGVRMALGAQKRHVRGAVLRQGSAASLVGILLGLAGALTLTRWLEALLFGVSRTDVSVYAGAALALFLTVLAAALVPARRAAAIDPVTAIRTE